jgi:hypothetical protein
MKRWEYLELEAQPGGSFGEWFVKGILYHADRKHEAFTNNQIGDALAKIGMDGWELVSSFHMEPSGLIAMKPSVHYVFKRKLDRI